MTLIDLTFDIVIDLTLVEDLIDNDGASDISFSLLGAMDRAPIRAPDRVSAPDRAPDRVSECVSECPECPICFESMKGKKRKLITLECKHVFHSVCLKKWAKKSYTCPMDRSAFNQNVLRTRHLCQTGVRR